MWSFEHAKAPKVRGVWVSARVLYRVLWYLSYISAGLHFPFKSGHAYFYYHFHIHWMNVVDYNGNERVPSCPTE
jgi:hypothetical protein